MLKFKSYLDNAFNNYHLDTVLENYDEYETFIELNETITGYDEGAEKTHPDNIRSSLESHVDAHYAKPKKARQAAVATAKAYFANTDLRTAEEKAHGEAYAAKRKEHNAKPENKKNQLPKSIFEKPLKWNGKVVTSTKKHKAHDQDYAIPSGEHQGKGAHVGGIRLTPGTANLGHGKVLRTCPAASKGCEGSGERDESGVRSSGAMCLAAKKGMDTTTASKADKLARTRALSDPKHQKHAAAIAASDLESMHKSAEKDHSVAFLRQRDSSDIDLFNGIRKKHFGDHPTYMEGKKANARMEGYGYSKYSDDKSKLGSNDDSDKDSKGEEKIYRSDTGPEHDKNGLPVPGQRARKENTIKHLLGGSHTRAYLVAGRVRDSSTKGKDDDVTKDIHTVRYHRYDKDGKYIGHEDFDAHAANSPEVAKHGDLHMFAGDAKRNTHSEDGREKGTVTVTDISGGNKADIESNPMVHSTDSHHITDDPEHPGKKILHVDPPHLKKKVIGIQAK